jgi:hypothetical protein
MEAAMSKIHFPPFPFTPLSPGHEALELRDVNAADCTVADAAALEADCARLDREIASYRDETARVNAQADALRELTAELNALGPIGAEPAPGPAAPDVEVDDPRALHAGRVRPCTCAVLGGRCVVDDCCPRHGVPSRPADPDPDPYGYFRGQVRSWPDALLISGVALADEGKFLFTGSAEEVAAKNDAFLDAASAELVARMEKPSPAQQASHKARRAA